LTVFTVSGIVHPSFCQLAAGRNLGEVVWPHMRPHDRTLQQRSILTDANTETLAKHRLLPDDGLVKPRHARVFIVNLNVNFNILKQLNK
jgi:hypothetical protein